jgi:hypothetical protein
VNYVDTARAYATPGGDGVADEVTVGEAIRG